MDISTSMLVKILSGAAVMRKIDVSSWRVELGMVPGLPSGTRFILLLTTKPHQSYTPSLSIVAYRTLDYIVQQCDVHLLCVVSIYTLYVACCHFLHVLFIHGCTASMFKDLLLA